MNEEMSNLSTSSGEKNPIEQSPGQLLYQARTAQKLNVENAAAELRLTPKYVISLEQDDFEHLPAEPFVVGYYKAYARLLGVDAVPIIAAYRLLNAAHSNSDASDEKPHANNGNPGLEFVNLWLPLLQTRLLQHRKTITLISILLLVLIIIFFLFSGDKVTPPLTESAEKSSVLIAETTNTSLDLGIDKTSSLIIHAEPSESVSTIKVDQKEVQSNSDVFFASQSTDLSVDAKLQVSVTDNTSSVSSMVALVDTLAVQFSDECWFEVVDATGKKIANNLYNRGDRISLQGEAPFEMLFGDARVVTVQLNGQEIAVVPQSDRKSLRLTIGNPQP